MKKIATLITAAFFCAVTVNIACCASTPQQQSANILLEMQAKKTSYIKDKIPAGIGIGVSKDEHIALEKADQNARVDLAKEIDTRVKALTKNFKEEVSGEIAEHFESASKSIVDTHLNGATLTDVKIETTEDGSYKVYGIIALNTNLVDEFIKSLQDTNAITDANAQKIRSAADKAYSELDATTK